MSAALPPWSWAGPRLEPALRGIAWPSQALAAAAADPERAIARVRFSPFSHVLLALDHGAHRSFVTRAHLQVWGVSAQVALAQACAGVVPAEGLEAHPLGWRLRGDNAVSQLVLPGFLRAFRDQCGEEVVAAAPLTDLLVIAPASRALALLDYARAAWEQGAVPVVAYLFADGADGVTLWRPSAEHPAARAQADAILRTARRAYREQTDAVEASYDVRFAPLGLLTDDAGALLSVAACTQGVDAWLPLAELVVLHPSEGAALWVRLTDLVAVLGDAVAQVEDLAPERLRLRRWPTSDEWRSLAARAVPERSGG